MMTESAWMVTCRILGRFNVRDDNGEQIAVSASCTAPATRS